MGQPKFKLNLTLLFGVAFFVIFFSLGAVLISHTYQPDCVYTPGQPAQCTYEALNAWEMTSEDWANLGETRRGDVVSYVIMAKAWLGQLPMDEGMMWRFKNWPPIIPLVTAVAIALESFWPLAATKLFLTSFVLALTWALFLKLVTLNFKASWKFTGFFFIFLLSPFLFGDFRSQLFGRGLFVSESLSFSFFILGLYCFFQTLLSPSWKYVFFTAAAWAVSANIRAQMDLVSLLGVAGFTFFMVVFYFLCPALKLSPITSSLKLKQLSVLLLTLFILSSPWKIRNWAKAGSFSMITTSESVYHFLWSPSDKVPSWLIGGNTACVVAPNLCSALNQSTQYSGDLKKHLTLSVLISKPSEWIKVRLKGWKLYWLPTILSEESVSENKDSISWRMSHFYFLQWPDLFFAFFCWMAVLVVLLMKGASKELKGQLALLILIFTGIYGIFFLLIPCEPRYFMVYRWLGFFFLMPLLAFKRKKA